MMSFPCYLMPPGLNRMSVANHLRFAELDVALRRTDTDLPSPVIENHCGLLSPDDPHGLSQSEPHGVVDTSLMMGTVAPASERNTKSVSTPTTPVTVSSPCILGRMDVYILVSCAAVG